MTSQPGKLTNTINNYTHFPISHQVKSRNEIWSGNRI